MDEESSDRYRNSLLEFETMWKGSERYFYAIVCETIGEDREAYAILTEEIISKWHKDHPQKTFINNKSDAIQGILSSFDYIANDPELLIDQDRRLEANKGMVVWLGLLKEMIR